MQVIGNLLRVLSIFRKYIVNRLPIALSFRFILIKKEGKYTSRLLLKKLIH
jgi:hypothetical protein